MTSHRWLKTAAAALAAALLVAACGLPVSDEVEIIPAEEHEELLLGTTTSTEPPPEPEDPGARSFQLFFTSQNQLEVVERPFNDAKVDDVLAALEAGPLPDEVAEFGDIGLLESRIPDGLAPNAIGRENPDEDTVQRVDVDPAGELRLRLAEDQAGARLIVSQIVCTILALPRETVTGVVIFDGEEEPLQLSDNNGEPIAGPATVEDFDNCRTGGDERDELLEEEGLLPDDEEDEDSTTTTSGG